MDQCKNLYAVWEHFVDKTVRIDKDFSDISIINFRDNSSYFGSVFELLGFINDIVRYLLGVVFGIPCYIIMDVL